MSLQTSLQQSGLIALAVVTPIQALLGLGLVLRRRLHPLSKRHFPLLLVSHVSAMMLVTWFHTRLYLGPGRMTCGATLWVGMLFPATYGLPYALRAWRLVVAHRQNSDMMHIVMKVANIGEDSHAVAVRARRTSWVRKHGRTTRDEGVGRQRLSPASMMARVCMPRMVRQFLPTSSVDRRSLAVCITSLTASMLLMLVVRLVDPEYAPGSGAATDCPLFKQVWFFLTAGVLLAGIIGYNGYVLQKEHVHDTARIRWELNCVAAVWMLACSIYFPILFIRPSWATDVPPEVVMSCMVSITMMLSVAMPLAKTVFATRGKGPDNHKVKSTYGMRQQQPRRRASILPQRTSQPSSPGALQARTERQKQLQLEQLARQTLTLVHVLAVPTGIQYFTLHLVDEVSVENLLFWIRVQELEAAPDPSSIPSSALRRVVTQFIIEGSEHQVNVSGQLRRRIVDAYDMMVTEEQSGGGGEVVLGESPSARSMVSGISSESVSSVGSVSAASSPPPGIAGSTMRGRATDQAGGEGSSGGNMRRLFSTMTVRSSGANPRLAPGARERIASQRVKLLTEVSAAGKEVFAMMARDTFARFVRTHHFSNMLREDGSVLLAAASASEPPGSIAEEKSSST